MRERYNTLHRVRRKPNTRHKPPDTAQICNDGIGEGWLLEKHEADVFHWRRTEEVLAHKPMLLKRVNQLNKN
jgi:hypothetical protein